MLDSKVCNFIIYLEKTCVDSGDLNIYKIDNIECCNYSNNFKLVKSIQINPTSSVKQIIMFDGNVYNCPQSVGNGRHISIVCSIPVKKLY